jgi:hypothetical protein
MPIGDIVMVAIALSMLALAAIFIGMPLMAMLFKLGMWWMNIVNSKLRLFK